MSTVQDNGRRKLVMAPTVPHHGVRLSTAIPVWISSAGINAVMMVAAFFLFTFLGNLGASETPEPEAPPPSMEAADEQPDTNDLTNTDIGLDTNEQLNYDNPRIEDVSVPGAVDPTAAVGIPNASPEAAPTNVPPPPGSGGGTGKGIYDPNESGTASMAGAEGGMGGRYNLGGFAGRSGSTRVQMLKEGGGNDLSEAAVATGLEWLAHHQASDGHWGLHDFHRHARTHPLPAGSVRPDASQPGTSRRNDTAGTAFGLLPFLAAGITNKPPAKKAQKDYHRSVNAGLRWLVLNQRKTGNDRGYYGGDMYSHALATIAMCEAYGLTSDPLLKQSAQLGINYTIYAQDEAGGGWRYQAKTAGDTSVTGWHLMALKSGQMSGLSVPQARLRKVETFLNSAETGTGGSGGGYAYTPGGGETYTMTAVGLLCRQYLGANPRNPALLNGITKLKAQPPGKTGNIYYEYYATQVMHHMGGESWNFWNLGPNGNGTGGIRDTLISRQDQGTGRNVGNKGTWAGNDHVGGRLGATALSLLTLEVYYRHLPLYRRDMGVVKPEAK